jgi:hypothetical protein
MVTLAHIAQLDEVPLSSYADPTNLEDVTCGALLVNMTRGASPLLTPDEIALVWGSTSRLDTAQTSLPSTASGRERINELLAVNAHVLRVSARLLKELIEASVYSDLAGAQQRRGAALDPLRGSRVAWGAADNEDGNYNTVAHAMRVLVGRLENGPYQRDRRCGGHAAKDALLRTYGAELTARIEDMPIRNRGQEFAARIVESNGILFPERLVDSLFDAARLERFLDALALQVAATSADLAGTDLTDPLAASEFMEQSEYLSARRVVADISREDMAFALRRASRTYRLIANEGEEFDVDRLRGGLERSAFVAPKLRELGGVVVRGGLSRTRLPMEAFARVGGLQANSQCAEPDTAGDWAIRPFAKRQPFKGVARSYAGHASTFQDVFSLAQSFQRRLFLLRDALRAREVGPDIAELADGGVTEISRWAGGGRVYATFTGRESALLSIGLEPGDVGRQRDVDVARAIKLFWGPAWVAECAAAQRPDCPRKLVDESELVATRSSALDLDSGGPGARLTRATFAYAGWAVESTYDLARILDESSVAGKDGPADHRLYVVLEGDQADPASRGRVLGAIGLRSALTTGDRKLVTSFPISPLQRDLVNQVLGFATMTRVDAPVASHPMTSCIVGVPSEPFLPLGSDAKTDADEFESSWLHYIHLARAAAERASQLGAEYAQASVERRMRSDAASEAVATECGDYGAAASVAVANGNVVARNDDSTLSECLEPRAVDVVTFSRATSTMSAEAKAKFVSDILQCEDRELSARNPTCRKLANDPSSIQVATANVIEDTPPTVSAHECEAVVSSVTTGNDGRFAPDRLAAAMNEPWATEESLLLASQLTRMSVDLNGEWDVSYGGRVVLNSRPGPRWPGCLREPRDAARCGGLILGAGARRAFQNEQITFWEALFRSAEARTRVLGGGSTEPGVSAERDAIRWRVQGAMWLLGATTGGVPAGMFTTPIPARDEGVPLADPHLLVTRFDSSVFPTLSREDPDRRALPESDRGFHRLGLTYPVSADFAVGLLRLGALLPSWYVDLYERRGAYRHLEPAGNVLVPSNYRQLHEDFLRGEGHRSQQWRESFDALDNGARNLIAARFAGSVCPTMLGNGDGLGPDAAALAAGLVAVLKSNHTPALREDARLTYGGTMGAPSYRCDRQRCYEQLQARGPTGEWLRSVAAGGISKDRMPAWSWLESWNEPDRLTHAFPSAYQQRGLVRGAAPPSDAVAVLRNPPEERVRAFVNSGAPAGACAARAEFVGSLGLACMLRASKTEPTFTVRPPGLRRFEDLERLEAWLGTVEDNLAVLGASLYLEHLPTRIVDVGSGGERHADSRGNLGAEYTTLRASVRSIPSGWAAIGETVGSLKHAVRSVRLLLAAMESPARERPLALALERARYAARVVGPIAALIGVGDSLIDPRVRGASRRYLSAVSIALQPIRDAGPEAALVRKVDAIEGIDDEKMRSHVVVALNSFSTSIVSAEREMAEKLKAVRASTYSVVQGAARLQGVRRRAQYAAVAAQDSALKNAALLGLRLPSGRAQARLSDGMRLRYQRALSEARSLAFLSKRALEQRIGLPLTAMVAKVGPIDVPARWEHEICTAKGISAAETSAGESSGSVPRPIAVPDKSQAPRLDVDSDVSVREWMSALEGLVQFFTLEFPSRDAEDTAVLSVRDDLLGATTVCMSQGANLLAHSARMGLSGEAVSEGVRGWVASGCPSGAAQCMSAYSGRPVQVASVNDTTIRPPLGAPNEAALASVSWLVDEAMTADNVAQVTVPGLDGGFLYQNVPLEPGHYVLSWWDQAVSSLGTVPSVPAVSYPVVIADEKWRFLHGDSFSPQPGAWSARRVMRFEITENAVYRVAIAASRGGRDGSVAIAGMQLERSSPNGYPTAFIPTGARTTTLSGACNGMTSASFRDAFVRRCDESSCFYETRYPVAIDPVALQVKANGAKIASRNYNFRHVSVAVNIVGTGARDCRDRGSLDCYLSGYTEYSLSHSATTAGVVDWYGNVREFNFGVARIDGAKALTAERHISMPMSASDSALISQVGILKTELIGRPLEGLYTLRVYESPALQWARVEDVQLVLRYRYWSRVHRE